MGTLHGDTVQGHHCTGILHGDVALLHGDIAQGYHCTRTLHGVLHGDTIAWGHHCMGTSHRDNAQGHCAGKLHGDIAREISLHGDIFAWGHCMETSLHRDIARGHCTGPLHRGVAQGHHCTGILCRDIAQGCCMWGIAQGCCMGTSLHQDTARWALYRAVILGCYTRGANAQRSSVGAQHCTGSRGGIRRCGGHHTWGGHRDMARAGVPAWQRGTFLRHGFVCPQAWGWMDGWTGEARHTAQGGTGAPSSQPSPLNHAGGVPVLPLPS